MAEHSAWERWNKQIRFCTAADGVQLAYATFGQGPPIVKVANWVTHLEFDWQSPLWRHRWEELGRSHQVIRYDERGCGLSDRDPEILSLDAFVSDLETGLVAGVRTPTSAALGLNQLPDHPGAMMATRTALTQMGFLLGGIIGGAVIAGPGHGVFGLVLAAALAASAALVLRVEDRCEPADSRFYQQNAPLRGPLRRGEREETAR